MLTSHRKNMSNANVLFFFIYIYIKINTPQLDTTVIQDTSRNNFLLEEEAFRIKSRISKLWDSNFKSRRLAYWQAFRNKKIAEKYEEWLTLESVILPQWIQMKPIANEPEALTKRREKQVLDNFRTEIELLHLRQESQEEKDKGIDDKIAEEINKLTSGQRRKALQKLWNDDCKRNENI